MSGNGSPPPKNPKAPTTPFEPLKAPMESDSDEDSGGGNPPPK